MKKKSEPAADRKRIQKTATELVRLRREMDRLRDKHPEFVEYDELQAQYDSVASQLKDLVRTLSVPGQAITALNTPDILVSVTGAESSVQYDLEKALDNWPGEILDEVSMHLINSKKVEELLAAGKLKDEVAAKAALPRKPLTPHVRIEIKS